MLLPFLVPIEVISFLARPVTLSVRLFANMLAGHITLKVMGGFVVSLLGAGAFAVVAPLPFVVAIALTAFELLVAVLQAMSSPFSLASISMMQFIRATEQNI